MSSSGSANGDGRAILIIGGGIAGLTAAIEAAEAGCKVVLIEKSAYLGGRVARLHQYFPKLCPPACGLEINLKRLKNNRQVTILTLAELESLSGTPGDYQAVINIAPRYVTDACTLCGDCAGACPAEIGDEFNYSLCKSKAIHLPHAMAFPAKYVIERSACPENCRACADACPYKAVDLAQKAEKRTLRVASVVVATGWAPYDARKIDNLGFGKYANVVTNVLVERFASSSGPTGGKVLRPSDGREPRSVAFVQCAGSRDQNHLPYCSAVCCSASLKHATYIRKLYPEAKITIFYIDLRTPGHLQEFFSKVTADGQIELIKGKVGKVEEDPASRELWVTAEDALNGKKLTRKYDLVVLATGMVPQTGGLPAVFDRDEFGFINNLKTGLYGTGCVKRPAEVSASIRDATGAALKALQVTLGATQHG
ncbi:MAG TPA: FAD-dependent oxidoreductase [Candidatus Acidoferrum sp.]|nr:FAD-dependent oxidoreductase [Candidatus Acidoferrum sp.]